MTTSFKRANRARGTAVLAAAASLGSLILTHTGPVAADPQSATALVGVGSDTTQDVMNALAGYSNGINYTPIQSSAISGRKQIASWDATPVNTCITPKPGPTFDRPNGSTNGRKALSRAIDGGTWGITNSTCAPAKSTAGVVDFARSSGGSSNTAATDLTYLPFGRDAVSFAYAVKSGSTAPTVTSLTTAQLQGLYTSTTPVVINGMNIVACLPQSGSGTRSFWVTTSMNTTDAIASAATAQCANAAPSTAIEENQADSLNTRAQLFPANTEVIIPHSAASFIAQSNGKAPSHLAAGVDLGTPDGVAPTSGTAPSLSPTAAFYGSTVYGRNVYNVVDTARATGFGNADLKSLFVGSSSAICSPPAQAIVNAFGFLSLTGAVQCGDTSVTGPLL